LVGIETFFFCILNRKFDFLEKYFDMNKKQCREALDMYKKFIDRTDKVSQYLKIAEVIVNIIF
jgi:hypothetical protein